MRPIPCPTACSPAAPSFGKILRALTILAAWAAGISSLLAAEPSQPGTLAPVKSAGKNAPASGSNTKNWRLRTNSTRPSPPSSESWPSTGKVPPSMWNPKRKHCGNSSDCTSWLNDLPAARECCQKWLAMDSKRFGPGHRQAMSDYIDRLAKADGQTRRQRASLERQLGLLLRHEKYREALPLAEHMAVIEQRVLGPEHPMCVNGLVAIAYCRQAIAVAGGAALPSPATQVPGTPEELYGRALRVYEKAYGRTDPMCAGIRFRLAEVHAWRHDYAAARSYYEQALAIRRKVLGEKHVETAATLNRLGVVAANQGDYAAARPYYEQALAIYEEVSGKKSANTAMVLNNLGWMLCDRGDYVGAKLVP